jgi:hypothetical protein
MNFADEILELEMICDDEDEVPEDKSIMRLIELYMVHLILNYRWELNIMSPLDQANINIL